MFHVQVKSVNFVSIKSNFIVAHVLVISSIFTLLITGNTLFILEILTVQDQIFQLESLNINVEFQLSVKFL